jgi:hypothetical protein
MESVVDTIATDTAREAERLSYSRSRSASFNS